MRPATTLWQSGIGAKSSKGHADPDDSPSSRKIPVSTAQSIPMRQNADRKIREEEQGDKSRQHHQKQVTNTGLLATD